MMAGTYLDALSTRGQAQARIAEMKRAIEQNRPSELAEVMGGLRGVGLDDQDSGAIVDVLDRHPDLLLKVQTAFELQIAGDDRRSLLAQSLWMFFADLLAAFIPVIPFAFFSPSHRPHRLHQYHCHAPAAALRRVWHRGQIEHPARRARDIGHRDRGGDCRI